MNSLFESSEYKDLTREIYDLRIKLKKIIAPESPPQEIARRAEQEGLVEDYLRWADLTIKLRELMHEAKVPPLIIEKTKNLLEAANYLNQNKNA